MNVITSSKKHIGLCHYCNKEKVVYNVDPLIISQDNCKGLFICKKCALAALKTEDYIDKIVNNVMGVTLYTEQEMHTLKKELDKLKEKRLNRPEFGKWWKHPLD